MPTKRRRDDDEDDDREDDREERDEKPRAPKPARGTVVPASTLKLMGMFAVCVLFFAVCGFLLFDRWAHDEEKAWLPFRLTWWGTALCVIGFVIGVGGMIAFPFEFFCPKQLIFGETAFQLTRKWPSGVVVEVHIPYANIKKVVHEKGGDDNWRVGISLYDPDDDDTYAKEPKDLQQYESQGRDYILDGGFTESLTQIAERLDKKRRKAKREREEAEEEDEG